MFTNGHGVLVSHSCFNGSGYQFDNLRLMWAHVAGYGLRDFSGNALMPDLPYDTYSDADLLGEWPEGAPDDPLIILLAHHEQLGRIKCEHTGYVADRLDEIVNQLLSGFAIPMAWVLMTQQFISGLRYASSQHSDVLFGREHE